MDKLPSTIFFTVLRSEKFFESKYTLFSISSFLVIIGRISKYFRLKKDSKFCQLAPATANYPNIQGD